MGCWRMILVSFTLVCTLVNCAVIAGDGDVDAQGLYRKSDHVVILTNRNFDRKIYGQKHAQVIQFYNSFCGHCRAFASKFKSLAAELVPWQPIVKLEVIDCSVEENIEICRQFEVMAYPTFRYFHENYISGNANIGEKLRLSSADSAEKFKIMLISKMQSEQASGRLSIAPSLNIAEYSSLSAVLKDMPMDTAYTFLIFEHDNSTIGSEIALDLNSYKNIRVKRVCDMSELAQILHIQRFPSVIVYSQSSSDTTILKPVSTAKQDILKAVREFLSLYNYRFPIYDYIDKDANHGSINKRLSDPQLDIVYYSDLEKTIRATLHTEVTRYKTLSEEALEALIDYLNVLVNNFPAKENLREYLRDIRDNLLLKSEFNGDEMYNLVKTLETRHSPVYTSDQDYIACKGSQPKYRGYTCGLWHLFHTLTVNAANQPGTEGPKVLQAMHGYVKNFFGCTECSQHFQDMASENRLFDVKENNKAVLWLWISHNEVNLRLAGDVTEDPDHPKIQFPSATNCPECRLVRGTWNLPAVYQYLQKVYSAENIQQTRRSWSAAIVMSPFSNLDLGMLSFLYILSFIILILVVKYFLNKRLYRKRFYKHGRGKV